MSDLIDRDFIKSLGGKCIAYRDEKTNELFPIIGIDALPSAQPELIRCKDCKYYKALDYTGYLGCNRRARAAFKMDLNDFCSRAERREDE